MTSNQGQSGQEENNLFLFFDWRPVKKFNFVTQNLANNRIFGDDLVNFSFEVYFPINTRVKKIVIWHVLIMSMDL